MARTELPNGVILPSEYSDDWYEDMTSNLTKLDDVIGSDSEKLNADGVDFLRMYSAALTDGGTGNFSDLNSSYKIKTGDLILDSGRKLYQVVSVDSTNERFTVGNSLFKVTAESDLAPVAESGDYDDLDNKPDLNPYDQHIADTDIHVTTADKNRWNNQTYVFRYSSTALVASSTNSNTLLDNTDNLKVGDKVIDSSGVLFSITAIDTQNSTFTIGTALIDLAQDSDVVHKSGDETVGGRKTFDSNTYIYNSDNTATTPSLYLRSSKIEISSQGNTSGDQNLTYLDKNNTSYAYIKGAIQSNGSTVKIRTIAKDSSDNSVINELQILAYTNGNKAVFPSYSNEVDLGVSSYKWKSFNGVEPSSLSLPSGNASDQIDISSYFSNTGSGDTNSYTAPANGWIYLHVTACKTLTAYIQTVTDTLYADYRERSSDGQIRITLPIQRNNKFTSHWTTSSTVNVTTARFIPCQGNV